MNSNKPYSSSLKRMLSYKLIQQINPQKLQIVTSKHNGVESSFFKQSKSQKQIINMKKRIIQNFAKKDHLQKQIECLIGRMTQEGAKKIKEKHIGRKTSQKKYRIVTEPNELTKNKNTLPTLKNISSYRNIAKSYRPRVKTQALSYDQKQQLQKDGEEVVNVGKYIKHYRKGMSSLNKVNIRPTH